MPLVLVPSRLKALASWYLSKNALHLKRFQEWKKKTMHTAISKEKETKKIIILWSEFLLTVLETFQCLAVSGTTEGTAGGVFSTGQSSSFISASLWTSQVVWHKDVSSHHLKCQERKKKISYVFKYKKSFPQVWGTWRQQQSDSLLKCTSCGLCGFRTPKHLHQTVPLCLLKVNQFRAVVKPHPHQSPSMVRLVRSSSSTPNMGLVSFSAEVSGGAAPH